MKRTAIFLIMLVVPLVVRAQENPPYDERGKKDPFLPLISPTGAAITYDGEMTVGDMALEGILADRSGKNLAIINGKVVKVGDQVGAYKIETIAVDYVDMIKDGEHFTLRLKKEAIDG